MSKQTSPIRLRTVLAAAAAAALMAGATMATPASAAEEDLFLKLDVGTLSVGEGSFALPDGGGFNGTIDDTTGAVAGTFVIPTVQSQVEQAPGVVADVTAEFNQEGTATGTIDPTTGDAAISATFRLDLSIALGGAVLTEDGCHVGPIVLDLTGSYDATAETLTLANTGFVIPPSTDCGGLSGIIDEFLAGDTAAELTFSRQATAIGVPTPPPPPAPAPAPAPPPAPVPAQPTFTG